MIVLAFGAASSGKSSFAERVACDLAKRDGLALDYLATMQPYGEVGRERVRRHRAMREGKGFATVECYGSLAEAQVPPESVVLLECLGNLVANLQFGEDWRQRPDDVVLSEALSGFVQLAARCTHLVVVSNDVGRDGGSYDTATLSYIDILGTLTNDVAARSDAVYEVVAGIPIALKGASFGLHS
ncbi:MAG: bifunctional adenosylcobinamide kinase/adenosylcobinamide-phosphate guanylyltransferase [Eggerthellaceae bacterium]